MQCQPRLPITDLLHDIDENLFASPDLFGVSPLEEAIASEVVGDVFLGYPGSSFMEMMEDARTHCPSYDTLQSSFIPELPIFAEDVTSLTFPFAETLPPSSNLVDFSSWSGSTEMMYGYEDDSTLSLAPSSSSSSSSSRLYEEYEYPTMVPSLFPSLVPFDSDTWDFEWTQRQREEERDSRVDPQSHEDGCPMSCPRCGWTASSPPVDPLSFWSYD
jgi:hypothetical protein